MFLAIRDSNKPFWPARWWWIALGVIFVAAAALRVTGYNFSLPYVDTSSEPNFALAGLATLTKGSARSVAMYGYAPGLTTIYYFLIRFFGDTNVTPLTLLGPVRLISVAVSLGSIVLIALLGYRASTPLAGLLAAGLWSVAPIAIEFSRYARPDYYLIFFCLLALFLSISAALYDRDDLAGWATVALMLGILFKYSAAAVTPAVLLPPALRWFGAPPEKKRRVLVSFGYNLLALAVFGFWLYALTPATSAEDIPNYAGTLNRFGLPSLNALWLNLAHGARGAGLGIAWIVAALGLLIAAWPRFRANLSPVALGALLVAIGLWEGGVSLYGPEDYRQLIFMNSLFVILFGVGLGLLAEGLVWASGRFKFPRAPLTARAAGLVVTVLVALVSIPQIVTSTQDAVEHTLPDRRVDLGRWGDVTLQPDTFYVGSEQTEKVFNRDYGGYTGVNPFKRFQNSRLNKQPLDYWRENDVKYAVLPYDEYLDLKSTPKQARAYLDQMTLLKSWPPSPQYRDPGLLVFSLYPIQHRLDAQLGPIRLVGYNLSSDHARPGEALALTLYWKAAAPASGDFKVFNHLLDKDSKLVAQADAPPLFDPRRPTSAWNDPDEVIMSQPFDLQIGENVAPGDYSLITGFYREDTGERLLGPKDEDHIQLVVIHVGS